MVKVLYKLFLAVMIALFIGFGVSVFYPAPKAPEYPTILELNGKLTELTQEQIQAQNNYDKQQKDFQAEFKTYNRNISSIIIGISVLLLILSLTVLLTIDIFGDGILLGGLFTLFYGIIRAFMSGDSKFQFIVVAIGLVIAIFLGNIKFIRPNKKNK